VKQGRQRRREESRKRAGEAGQGWLKKGKQRNSNFHPERDPRGTVRATKRGGVRERKKAKEPITRLIVDRNLIKKRGRGEGPRQGKKLSRTKKVASLIATRERNLEE